MNTPELPRMACMREKRHGPHDWPGRESKEYHCLGWPWPLTAADVAATLDDPRHEGWGYGCSVRYQVPEQVVADLDAAVAAVANELRLTPEQLFQWSDSKHGRWLWDDVHGCDAPPTVETVRKHMNEDSTR